MSRVHNKRGEGDRLRTELIEAATALLTRTHDLAVPSAYAADEPIIRERLADLPEYFNLAEPFARIRDAIEEAQRGGKA